MAGFKKSVITRAKFGWADRERREIIANIASLKTASTDTFLINIGYIFDNFKSITDFYDENLRFAKIKLANYIKKQKALSEIFKRLLTGSNKYSNIPDINERRNK